MDGGSQVCRGDIDSETFPKCSRSQSDHPGLERKYLDFSGTSKRNTIIGTVPTAH